MAPKSEFISQFLDYISSQNLIGEDKVTLLAVSGGVDSVVMAHIFKEVGAPFAMAHCNFKLRGKESEEDEVFVEGLATSYEVPFHTKRFDTRRYGENNQISVQMAARELRYSWFYKILKEHGYASVATAHHKDDQIETVLLNLTKGTGISGLHGIMPRNRATIRPLLFATKEQIVQFAKEHEIKWREDTSNQSLKYQRNLIRTKVVPVLKEINPSLNKTLQDSLEKIRSAELVYRKEIEEWKTKLADFRGRHIYFDKKEMLKFSLPLILVYEMLKDFGFNYEQSKDILKSINNTGNTFESGSWVLNIDRQDLILSKRDSPAIEEAVIEAADNFVDYRDFGLKFSVENTKNASIEPHPNVAQADLKKLRFPLVIRPWKEGDKFVPLGMKRQKKLSDYMIDEKIPLNLKADVCVILSEDKIVWVVGKRLDDRFKVTKDTTDIFRMEISP